MPPPSVGAIGFSNGYCGSTRSAMSLKCCIGSPTCRNSAQARIEPTSSTFSSTRSAARASSSDANRSMTAARSRGDSHGHGPSSNARRAAATARSMSATVPSGTVPMASSVAGFSTVSTESPSLPVHAPSM